MGWIAGTRGDMLRRMPRFPAEDDLSGGSEWWGEDGTTGSGDDVADALPDQGS